MTTRFPAGFALVFSSVLLLPATSSASSPNPMSMPPAQKLTPEQEAARSFNDGLDYQQKADKLDKESAAETDAKKREKLAKKSLSKYEDAIEKFTDATRKNPKLFQAWGSLGYSYRKSGKYTESLAAYNQALELEPGYTPAIEYRAEAFLELDRLDDVKSAYLILFQHDRPRADELSAAIDKWVARREAAPGSLDPAAVESFAKWATERRQLASQTSALLQPAREGW